MLNRVIIKKSSTLMRLSGVVLGALALVVSGCGGSKKAVMVGAKSTTAESVIAEIVAQHLEHTLGRKIARNLNMGTTPLLYQSLMNGEIGIYPEDTGTIQTNILKETPSLDAGTVLERVRNEMRRIAQVEVMDPLGINNDWAVTIPKSDAEKFNVTTLSEAQNNKGGWKIGVTHDFSERSDGQPFLNLYRLPMGAMPRVTDSGSLYDGLAKGELTMVVGNVTDGPLSRHNDWVTLKDDKKIFPFYQTCLLVRADLLASDPKIQPALAQLSGKFTNDALAKLNARVDVDHKVLSDVAGEFLKQSGLK